MAVEDYEIQLVRQMMADEDGAFEALMERYYPNALRMAYLISGNHADSEDIVQETFVACYYKRKKIKEPEHFDRWLCKILSRTAWRLCRKSRREQPVEEVFPEAEPESPSVLDQVMRNQEQMALYQRIEALPIKQRTVIVLYYFNQMSTKEIAGVMNCLEGTVKSRLYTARTNLKQALVTADRPLGEEAPS